MTWRRVAEVLAREATYRSRRKTGRSIRLLKLTGGSMVKYNALLLVLFSLISLGTGFSALGGRDVAYANLVMLFVMEILMGVLFMALNLQVLVSDRLLEPMFHLPLEETEIRRALSWIGIYWGGAALPSILIPAGIVASIILGDPSILAGALIGSLVALALSLAVGYLAGSLATRYTRSLRGRAISTSVWLLVLGIGFLMGPLAEGVSAMRGSELLAALPPLCFSLALSSPLALASSLALISASYALLRVGTARFWRVATRGEVAPPRGPAKWSLNFGVRAALMRDLKLVSRTPRILASVIMYSFMFPLAFLLPMLSGGVPPELKGALLPIALAVGGLGGFSVLYLYVVEAAGARTLYSLPLTRADVAGLKFLAHSVMNLPIACAVAAVLSVMMPSGAFPALLYLASFLGSALLNSLVYAAMLPDEPSHWSTETFGRAVIGVIFIVESVAYMALALIPILVPGSGALLALAGVASIWILDGALMRYGRRPL